jgi:hypothetical protein
VHSFDDYVEMTPDEIEAIVETDESRRELEIQIRMYREGARAVREEVEWLEKHNFPIWILHNDEIIDYRTLSKEERASMQRPEQDLSKPEMMLRLMTEEEKAERDRKRAEEQD